MSPDCPLAPMSAYPRSSAKKRRKLGCFPGTEVEMDRGIPGTREENFSYMAPIEPANDWNGAPEPGDSSTPVEAVTELLVE